MVLPARTRSAMPMELWVAEAMQWGLTADRKMGLVSYPQLRSITCRIATCLWVKALTASGGGLQRMIENCKGRTDKKIQFSSKSFTHTRSITSNYSVGLARLPARDRGTWGQAQPLGILWRVVVAASILLINKTTNTQQGSKRVIVKVREG